ncbi:MAG: ABC transporter permease [Candidatus Kariarchaeaceae archaeon]|jgi:ABC-type antimicrobial peptide transport system permease subunit
MVVGRIDAGITLFKTIYRTRRRAFALISGIMLATMILSGIILYSNVLTQRNFESIVGDTSYEIAFNKYNDERFSTLNDIGQSLITDPQFSDRVDTYAVIGGIQSNRQNSIFDITVQPQNGSDYFKEDLQNGADFEALFVDQNFFSSEIGQSIQDIYYDGEFRLPTVDEVIIPRSVATTTGLGLGDVINRINFTMTIFEDEGQVADSATSATFTIIGIYDQEAGFFFDTGDFGLAPVLDYYNLILNHELLQTDLNEIESVMRQSGNFQLLVSINENAFTVSQPDDFVTELSILMNQISQKYGGDDEDLVGVNMIEGILLGFTIFSLLVSIMYVLISIPVIILSLYVLTYGLTVSLEERKREIAIKKVQGASGGQIFNEMRNETFLIYVLGIAFGYILATFVAFIIGNAVGFFQIELGSLDAYFDYISFNLTAILVSAIGIGVIMLFVVYRQGKGFIQEEVTSAISKKKEVTYGFLRSTNLDLALFGIGAIGFGLSFAEQVMDIDVGGGTALVLVQIFTPFFIWIGGAVVGSRIVQFIPRFLEPVYLRLFVFKDVSRLIKAGLRRRGDINKLAIVIILSLAVASMAVIQGVTDEAQVQSNIEYTVGSDFKVLTSDFLPIIDNLTSISEVEAVQALPLVTGRVLSSRVAVAGIDPALEQLYMDQGGILLWQKDSFATGTAETAMEHLEEKPRGVFISAGLSGDLGKGTGDTLTLSVDLLFPTLNASQAAIKDIEILGVFNLLPSASPANVLTSHDMVKEIAVTSFDPDLEIDEVLLDQVDITANQYQVKLTDSDITEAEISAIKEKLLGIDNVAAITSLQEELNGLAESGTGFGITGLLTLAASVSLLATFVSSFAFSSIIMERRKQEFAVLRAVGARKSQIYKLAMGENFLMMLIGVIWGTLIGVAVAVIFNGFFGFVSAELLRQLTVRRIIIFPWTQLTLFAGITLLGMMLATILSIRQSVNADLTTATRAE